MPRRLVEITSVYPGLLPCLVKAKQQSPYSIIEREDKYYLNFFDSDAPRNTENAKQSADVLLSNINAILTLPPFKVAHALKRTHHIITLDENGSAIGENSSDLMTRLGLSPDFTTVDFSPLFEMEVKASKLTRIKQALWYYAEPISWFSLYDGCHPDYCVTTSGEKRLP